MFLYFAFLIACFACIVEATQYCATIASGEAAGAEGWVALQIVDGVAQYSFKLDLSSYYSDALCPNIDSGLKYHIHNTWANGSAFSAANSACGASYAGGHYDPNFACSNFSSAIGSECKALNRTWGHGYHYGCNSTMYSNGHYSLCEVGDISAKAGIVYLDSNRVAQKTFVDYQPPYAVNYNQADMDSTKWLSWVFHCAENSNRLVCAKFSMTELMPCQDGFDSFVATTSNDDNVSTTRYNVAIILSTILCTFGGILIGAFLTYFYLGSSSEERAPMSKV